MANKGDVLDSVEFPAEDFIYRGHVLVGHRDEDKVLVYTRIPVNGGKVETLCPSHFTGDTRALLQRINATLMVKHHPRLPDKTSEAKALASIAFALNVRRGSPYREA